MPDSVRPQRRPPTRLPRPWDSPGKNTGVGCYFLLQCMKVKSKSQVTQSCLTLATPWTAAHQAPPSMGFSRQEHWSGRRRLLHHWPLFVPVMDSVILCSSVVMGQSPGALTTQPLRVILPRNTTEILSPGNPVLDALVSQDPL